MFALCFSIGKYGSNAHLGFTANDSLINLIVIIRGWGITELRSSGSISSMVNEEATQ